ncbi:MAG: ribbon-helix-helix domain-containing protein [Candidatus Scalinduaceae bacterium]
MDLKQSCNVFLTGKQYKGIKELSYRLNIPYSELVREGVNIILRKYRNKQDSK